jgi:glutamate-1-semialdehyde aminotransferase
LAPRAAFVITIRFNDLAELEQLRKHMRTDPAAIDFHAKLATLSRLSPQLELLEVLVLLPS